MGVAVYTRISDDREGAGLGVARQEADCRALAESRGWDVAEVFSDNDVGAYSRKPRPAYRRLLEAMKNGDVDGVVMWHLDRLARRPRDLEDFLDVCTAKGITKVAACHGDFDLTTSDGQFMAGILVLAARKESDDKSRRTKRKHLELAQEGRPAGGGRAFGYRPGGLEVESEEVELIREAARRVLAGDSIWSIAQDWNARGVVAPRGGRVTQTFLRRVLTNPRTAGKRALNGEVVADGQWPAILDELTWRRVGATLDSRSGLGGRAGFGARTYLLTGFLLCGRCGTALIAQARKRQEQRRRTYLCPTNPDKGGCGGIRITAEPLEELLVTGVLDALPDVRARLVAAHDEEAEVAALDRIAGLEARLDEAAADHYAGVITRRQLLAANDRLGHELTEARQTLTAARPPAVDAITEVDHDTWEQLNLERKRVVIAEVVESVTIQPATPGTTRFDPARVEITMRI